MGWRRGIQDLLYVFGHPLTEKIEVFVRDHCIEDDVAFRSNGIEGLFQVRVGERFGCALFRCDGDFHGYSSPFEKCWTLSQIRANFCSRLGWRGTSVT